MKLRAIKQRILKQFGLASYCWRYRSNGLYCFNFHRIGDWQQSEFDPCVFSCDVDSLKQYLRFFQQHFRLVSMVELNDIVQNNREINERLALVTFDDGYSDNYSIAYPILREMGIPATFFVTTNLVESETLPWWDEIAWHIRRCAGQELKLSGWLQSVSISDQVTKQDIRLVLQAVKTCDTTIEQQLLELRQFSGAEVPTDKAQDMFISWAQLKELAENGIDIGAHSHSHRILSQLSEQDLSYELAQPKHLIEKNIATDVISLSYPVGNSSTYSKSMFDEISKCGYQLAFSFRSHINRQLKANQYQLGRFSIDEPFDANKLKAMVLSADKH